MSEYRLKTFNEYLKEYKLSVDKPEEFWSGIASNFKWKSKWDKVLKWNFKDPDVKWFINGKLNITENCLDRHLEERGDKTAVIWEPNDINDKEVRLSYRELHEKVCQFANVLRSHHISKGDRVCIYMPMIPELLIGVLACARIGAIHSVVFAGFSANALADRINDAKAKLVLTSDGMRRGKKNIGVKKVVDQALESCDSVETVMCYKHTEEAISWVDGRDYDWKKEVQNAELSCEAEVMDAEDTLFILYTSGSTGKPKGVVHSCGGYMVYAGYSFMNVFQYDEGDIYWCTADIGWITGHTYIAYGPLLNGATTIMFEGVPTFPDAGRFWDIVDKYKVSQFYTAPTAIRALMACGDHFVESKQLDSLKVIGTVGEPINHEAWKWYADKVGKNNCPVVDTWWQTETGGIMISGLGKLSPQKPTYAGLPLPGIQPMIIDQEGKEVTTAGEEGYLVMKFPWPSILRTTYGDHDRCKNTYFNHYPDLYFTGDGAKFDENGLFRIIGRVDDVINVSGHRFGTAEIENAINTNSSVVESAVVGYPHDIKGQGIYAFVICESEVTDAGAMRKSINKSVETGIGNIARPEKIQFVNGLPKTRSGKIMRRILRKIAENDVAHIGDTSTLLDPSIVDEILKNAL